MLGEVGVDRAFRVAFDYHASPRRLTPFMIPLDRSSPLFGTIRVLMRLCRPTGDPRAQIDLAVELGRSVSLHSVKCPMATVDLLNKLKVKHGQQWENIRIDIHSCSMNPQVWTGLQKKHANVFLSLSTVINGRSNNMNALIAACPSDRILIESDFNDINMCTERCIEMLNVVARAKGWHVEEEWLDDVAASDWGIVRRLEANWKAFRDGGKN
ncbi:hypothetical protein B0H17DRAFT_1081002 [Mycena rosella]|uniref:Metallo-dependent hydrolase n=1 Tax=Mycena rosella TaxID=1033263 RepID=A0AAD7D2T5_MYCRO|nr:hypothetical protein B0H17DRAFT_1081002 [Mycena rosella]